MPSSLILSSLKISSLKYFYLKKKYFFPHPIIASPFLMSLLPDIWHLSFFHSILCDTFKICISTLQYCLKVDQFGPTKNDNFICFDVVSTCVLWILFIDVSFPLRRNPSQSPNILITVSLTTIRIYANTIHLLNDYRI